MTPRRSPAESPVAAAIARTRGVMIAVGVFSAIVNVLNLTGSLYMLQVYDRVLASRSVATLVAISLLALGLYALQGVLEVVRGYVMSRIGARIERDLLKPVHELLLRLPMAGRSPADATQPVRDMEAVRGFMSSQGPLAFLDLPWAPFYMAFIFLLHPYLGFLALAGVVILAFLAYLTETRMRTPNREATVAAARRQMAVESSRRNVEVLRAMGFSNRVASRFYRASGELISANQKISDVTSSLGSTSRIIRAVLQSAILGLGAYLVVKGQMSAGAIIASSILAGRAMAPVEMAIGSWKLFIAARQARNRLEELTRALGTEQERIDLPQAKSTVTVENVTIGPPGARHATLRNARLALKAGDAVAVLGPSGAGKSTLARAMVGAWPLMGGAIRLDGAPLDQWPEQSLGRLIGYLPQDVELFDGTIAENIARLDPEAEDAAIVAAAQAANVHEMILRLPNGYATMLGEGGHNLSVGQRQRIGLARALYGDPFLLVLDEPNAHLDQEGEAALADALRAIRARGGVVVAVSHRRGILEHVNLAAFVADGEIKLFGPRDEVLKRLMEAQNPPPNAQPGQPPAAAPQAAPPPQPQPDPRPRAAPAAPVHPFPTSASTVVNARLGSFRPPRSPSARPPQAEPPAAAGDAPAEPVQREAKP